MVKAVMFTQLYKVTTRYVRIHIARQLANINCDQIFQISHFYLIIFITTTQTILDNSYIILHGIQCSNY